MILHLNLEILESFLLLGLALTCTYHSLRNIQLQRKLDAIDLLFKSIQKDQMILQATPCHEQSIAELLEAIERSEKTKTALESFVQHGDRVVGRLEALIKSGFGRN